jgi:hypothetical protein
MEDRLGSHLLDDRRHPLAVDDVELDQARGWRHAAALAGGEVVDHRHLVATREQRVDEVRADEAGPAGHDRLLCHARESIEVHSRPVAGRARAGMRQPTACSRGAS